MVKVSKPFDAPDLLPVPPDSLDAVIIHLNYHDMVGFKLNRDNVNAAVFKALKPGGIYGIVDHSAKPGRAIRETATLHRIDEDFLIKDVEKAGFKLTARRARCGIRRTIAPGWCSSIAARPIASCSSS